MKIIESNGNTLIKNVKDFNIEQTLECGQCFNFDKIADLEYAVVARGRLLHVKQENNDLILYGVREEKEIADWLAYFDLQRDYEEIKSFLLNRDQLLYDSIQEKNGIRILNQEFYEVLLSFIISQSKNISHIKQIVFQISKKYGQILGKINDKEYYSFPSIERLSKLSIEDFREAKTGYRAPYLYDAVMHLYKDSLNEVSFENLPIEEARNRLLQIKGVGTKVANCVLLYGLGYRDAFPVDVWIKRIMEELYFKKHVSIEEIQELALERFGKYGGYAQQYLFYFGREKKIGKITRK